MGKLWLVGVCAVAAVGCQHSGVPTASTTSSVVGVWGLDLSQERSAVGRKGDSIIDPELLHWTESETIEFKADGTLVEKADATKDTLFGTGKAVPARNEAGTYITIGAEGGSLVDLTTVTVNGPERQQWILSADGKTLRAYNSWNDAQPQIWIRR